MTQDDEMFEKLYPIAAHAIQYFPDKPETLKFHDMRNAFLNGRLVQMDKDAEICEKTRSMANGNYFAATIREQEIP